MNMRIHRTCLTFALLASLGGSACASEPRPRVVLHGERGEVTIKVEMAATPEKRALGLMYRRDLAADAGMLFVFDESAPLSFWMENTPLALDMIFIGEDLRIVGIVKNAEPFTTTPRRVDTPSRYVLEVNAGLSERHGIRSGDRVSFEGVPGVPVTR